MNCSTIINSLGLIFDITGAVLIFFYGITPLLTKEGGDVIITSSKEENKKEYKKHSFWSKFGLLLLAFGFILQLISNFIPNSSS